jgi:NAD(P)-dependent dehydrogenase (short-subunit alcohol dehydrogenase family)
MERICLVTGATSGIGLATAATLAGLGNRVIGVGRDQNRCSEARRQILIRHPGAQVEYALCDLSSQSQVRALARSMRDSLDHLDALIHVAGAVSSYFMTTEDAIELQLAVNHLAPFLLTHELMGLMRASSDARIVTVSSGSHYHTKLDFSDLQMRRRYNCLHQYQRVKLCNILFTAELNRRFGESGTLRAFAADPGLVRTEIGLKGTAGIERFAWKLRMRSGVDPSVPAEAIAFLATDASMSGRREPYWYQKKPRAPSPYALREDAARLLWNASERLCGIRSYGTIIE